MKYLILLFIFFLSFSCKRNTERKYYVIKGSESIIDIISKAKEGIHPTPEGYFKVKNTKDNYIHFGSGGSSRGLAAIIGQTTDIAISNHRFTFDQRKLLEKYHVKAKLYAFAQSEIVFVTHKDNPLISLKLSQLQDIFRGVIPAWTLEREESIKSRQLDQIKAKAKSRKGKLYLRTDNFDENEPITLTGRRNSSGNYFWVYNNILFRKSFSREILDFSNDIGIHNAVKQLKYGIGYVSKSNFKTELSGNEILSFETKLESGTINLDEMEKLILGKDLKRILIYNDIGSKNKQSSKQLYDLYRIKPIVYIVIPEEKEKELEPIIDFLYSNEVRNLLLEHGLIPLNKKEETIVEVTP